MATESVPAEQAQADVNYGGAERRRAPRAHLETEVSFQSDDNFFAGFSEDVSEGGLFVATYDLKAVGTRVNLTFSLPEGTSIETTGEVRWLRDPRDRDAGVSPGMGIQFDALSEPEKAKITEFVKARSPMFYEDV